MDPSHLSFFGSILSRNTISYVLCAIWGSAGVTTNDQVFLNEMRDGSEYLQSGIFVSI